MLNRHIMPKLLKALELMPIVLLRGARQIGKTTLAKYIGTLKPEYTYYSLDHIPTLVSAQEDPVGFIARLQKPAIIDEIQRVPELFLPIKCDVDEQRIPGRYFLTGSADPLLIPKMADSLAGRMRLLNLWPLSQSEIDSTQESFLDSLFNPSPQRTSHQFACSKVEVLSRITRGGYPAAFAMHTEQQRADWFNDYVTLVLQKDILDLSKIENVGQMPHLLMLLASRASGILNTEELARTTKLSAPTLQRYLELLRTLFLIHLQPAWHSNLGKRLVKSPKIYMTDTAFQLFLLNIDSTRLIQDPYLTDAIIENFVVLELLKHISWANRNISMFHYRDYNHAEIDIILESPGGDIVAVEVKGSETIGADDFKRIKKLQVDLGKKFIQGIVLYAGNMSLPFGKDLMALPISSLWQI